MKEKTWLSIEIGVCIVFLIINIICITITEELYAKVFFFIGALLFSFSIKNKWNRLKLL